MIYMNTTRIHHRNELSTGNCHYYVSIKSGKRLLFRENEIREVRAGPFGTAVVVHTSGYEYGVTDSEPETIS